MRIVCMGDSTMQYNDCTTYPQTGWPQALARYLPKDTVILNFAKNGRSTKSFIDQGLFDEVLANVKDGDYVLIEFGHNDEKIEDPSRYAKADKEYMENLSFFVNKLREKKAYPIILTSIARRKFADDHKTVVPTHGIYPECALKAAEKLNVPAIDMDKITQKLIQTMGEKKSLNLFMNFDAGLYANYPQGRDDNTHLRYDGAFHIAGIAAEQIALIADKWSDYRQLSDSVIKTDASQIEMLASLPEEP